MTVVLISETFFVGNNGITISAMRHAKTLKERGHTVRVVAKGDVLNSGIDEATGYEMYYVPELWIPLVTHLAHRQNTLLAKPVRKTLVKAITGADVVHIYQAWPLGSAACTVAKKLGVPTIAAFHIQPENITWNLGLGWFRPAAWLVYFLMKVIFYRRLNHIHCPSPMIASQLRIHNYKAWLHVVSNGVDPAFCPDEQVEKFDDGKFHIVMVGRFSPEKRQEVLLRAVKCSRHCDRIQLHLAGHGYRENHLRKLGARLPNAPDISYHNQPELIELLRRCHLYVHASDIEIEGMGCTEALSCGLVPVISDSKRSATGSFALDSKNIFRSGDAVSLAQKIDYWIEHPDELAEAGKVYAEYARQYALEDCVRQMERVYARLHTKEKCVYHRGRIFRLISQAIVSFFVIPVLFLWTRIVLGARIEGENKLRGLKSAITVCNHVHHLDSAIVAISLFPRRIAFTTLASNMRGLFPGVFVRLFGGTPVPENVSDLKVFFDEMEIRLLSGQFVHFFPEGHLLPYSPEIRNFKNGAFYMAAKARVPIVPMAIHFVPPPGIYRFIRRKPVMRITMGEPIYPVAADVKRDAKLRRDMSRDWMQSAVSRRG